MDRGRSRWQLIVVTHPRLVSSSSSKRSDSSISRSPPNCAWSLSLRPSSVWDILRARLGRKSDKYRKGILDGGQWTIPAWPGRASQVLQKFPLWMSGQHLARVSREGLNSLFRKVPRALTPLSLSQTSSQVTFRIFLAFDCGVEQRKNWSVGWS